ncbi:MFS transporter [Glacieibacterium frigidum]|uniref:MFS transporter n=1 Tax=Glacieibacterium frigidum TaxID=2593303 RepID=A0A552UEQ6_9SPHN|nr:MFS transporter [Glacieibacterium frigidum]TRW16718.1 MFS transporter [Glacieibacterium frigidum]
MTATPPPRTAADADAFFDAIDNAPLTDRFWLAVGLLMLVSVFDYFDFFIVGFVISVVGPAWQLTYAQTSIVLLSAGLGSIVGALVLGPISDRFGRKPMLIGAVALCAISSGAVGFIADGSWQLFAVLRFLAGFGISGATLASITIAVEITPTRVRTMLTSAMIVPVSFGILAAAALSSTMLPVIGWRGLAMIGFVPLVLLIPCMFFVPESVRWLVVRGRAREAHAVAAHQLRQPALPPAPAKLDSRVDASRWSDIYADPRRFWFVVLMWVGFSAASYGVYLWGPTILSLVLGVTPSEAAGMFVMVGLAGIAGRIAFSVVPQFIGRRRAGQLIGFGIALALGAAAFSSDALVGALPLLLICLIVGAVFFDGGAVNLGPMPTELFPARLAARGTGLGQAANGAGRIIGPLVLALIAGANNVVTPAATKSAVVPGFLFLAACGLVVGLAFTFLGIETHGRRLALEDPAADGKS